MTRQGVMTRRPTQFRTSLCKNGDLELRRIVLGSAYPSANLTSCAFKRFSALLFPLVKPLGMQIRASLLILALAVAFAAGQGDDAGPMCTGNATYVITNSCQWTSMRHPVDYPSGASFSPMCGTAHNSDYDMFAVRTLAALVFASY